MKKFDNSTFDIESTTIRELNPNEIKQVGGAGDDDWTTIIFTVSSVLLSCVLCEDDPD